MGKYKKSALTYQPSVKLFFFFFSGIAINHLIMLYKSNSIYKAKPLFLHLAPFTYFTLYWENNWLCSWITSLVFLHLLLCGGGVVQGTKILYLMLLLVICPVFVLFCLFCSLAFYHFGIVLLFRTWVKNCSSNLVCPCCVIEPKKFCSIVLSAYN